MIAFLDGIIKHKSADRVIIDVSGVGYEVFMPVLDLNTMPSAGERASIYTYLHVREGVMQLFGFVDAEEKELFEQLIGVTGIGPKVAISILSVFPVNAFKKAVAETDVDAITTIPGIGAKGAKRLILELQEKLIPAEGMEMPAGVPESAAQAFSEAKNALIGLGYTANEASRALEGYHGGDGTPDVEDLLKYALKNLAQL